MIKRLLLLFSVVLLGCGKSAAPQADDQPPGRIISLAPNITDTLLELGLENRLVGVSRFSSGTAKPDLPVVGDFMSINYEAVISLQPDLVVLEKSSDDQKARFENLGIPYLETGSLTIDDILISIRSIGEVCGVEEEATELIARLKQQMDAALNTPDHRLRTLLTFSDFSDQEKIEQVYAFGAACIHSELLGMAGADNVITDARPSVVLSREAIIRLNPELIIELTAGGPTNHWESLSAVDAVMHHRVYVLEGPYTTIPSPGFLMRTLADFSGIIRQITMETNE
jgi:ABC-type Fe3+-hydroxamate transport system substrate-binding protein